MRLPPERPVDVLALVSDPAPMRALLDGMIAQGFHVDVVHDRAAALQSFFAAGGHHLLLVAPDVAPGTSFRVFEELRGMDPELRAVAFGAPAARLPLPEGVTVLPGLHPSTRAGLGSLLRTLRELPDR